MSDRDKSPLRTARRFPCSEESSQSSTTATPSPSWFPASMLEHQIHSGGIGRKSTMKRSIPSRCHRAHQPASSYSSSRAAGCGTPGQASESQFHAESPVKKVTGQQSCQAAQVSESFTDSCWQPRSVAESHTVAADKGLTKAAALALINGFGGRAASPS